MDKVGPEPTGQCHEVGVDELFFSTTDRRGVIEQANSVFVRISRYPWEELVNAPHNIIRHPDMPGGAFLALWSMLLDGKPSCAYVHNLAADGSRYTVFATITPLGDGFLSVRTRPCRRDLLDAADQLYRSTRPIELEARANGASAHEAAVRGAEHLTAQLVELGFNGYPDFVAAAIPAEVDARAQLSAGLPDRPYATGRHGEILRAVRAMETELTQLMDATHKLSEASSALQSASDQARSAGGEREALAARIAEVAATNSAFAPILMPIELWVSMSEETKRTLMEVTESLSRLQRTCTEARLRFSLAQLHTDMVGQFAVELIDAVPGHDREPAMVSLCDAITHGIQDTEQAMRRNEALAAKAATLINESTGVLQMPLDLIAAWRERAATRDDRVVAELIPLVDEQVTASTDSIASLRDLAKQCAEIAQPLRIDEIQRQVNMISAAVGRRSDQPW